MPNRSELSGTLDGIGLKPLLAFLEQLKKSGHLVIEDQDWVGTLALADGQLVGATFGGEQGLQALDAIFFALPHGRFQFSASESCEVNLVVEPGALAKHLDELAAEVAHLTTLVPSLGAVPRVIELERTDSGQVSLSRNALRLLVAIDGRHSVAEHIRVRGVLTTLRELAELTQLGLVTADLPANGTVPSRDTADAGSQTDAAGSPVASGDQVDDRLASRRSSIDAQAAAAAPRRHALHGDPAPAQSAEPPVTATNRRRLWR
jgi:hypothetical protein